MANSVDPCVVLADALMNGEGMKKLVLAEKPSVAKEIARVLNCHQSKNGSIEGKDYIVTWALGHLVTLADPDHYDKKYKEWVLDDLPILPKHLKKIVIGKSSKQFNTVKHAINRDDVSEIIIATDAGREGELVARWIIEKSGSKKNIKRLWISSITDKAIKDGFKNLKPGNDFIPLYQAAIARAESDWIVGINATRALTTKYNSQLSCGRVQTPTLAIIGQREDEIRNFKPREYFTLSLLSNGVKFHAIDGKRYFDEREINQVYDQLKNEIPKVIRNDSKQKKTYAQPLYDLTELQRVAFSRYSMSPKKTLSVMQRLYEHHKVLTYPRTDSRYLTDDMFDTLNDRLRAIQVQPYQRTAFKVLKQGIHNKNFINNKKVTDHHAIIPTEEAALISDFTNDERKIYDLVVARFLENLMPPYIYQENTIEIKLGKFFFVSKFNKTIQMGYKEVENGSKEDNSFNINNVLGSKLSIDKGQTKAPNYFNEGTLLTVMENPTSFMEDSTLKNIIKATGGLGTVATRADIIEKLFATHVIEVKGKDIHITNKGKQLLTVVPEELKSPKLTAEWEQKFDQIAKRQLKHEPFLNEMKQYTQKIINDIKASETKFKHDNLSSTKCPECGKLMLVVKTKHGQSYVCQDKSCNHRISISRTTNARCPECHKKLELRGSGDKKIFVCKCGYREKLSNFEKRKKENTSGGKKDYVNYLKKQKKIEEKQAEANNPFAKLKGLNIDK